MCKYIRLTLPAIKNHFTNRAKQSFGAIGGILAFVQNDLYFRHMDAFVMGL